MLTPKQLKKRREERELLKAEKVLREVRFNRMKELLKTYNWFDLPDCYLVDY